MEITECLLTPGAAHGRPGAKLAPEGIVVHYVGNPGSTAKANRDYFESCGNASAHYIVGLAGEIIRCVPDNEIAWHAGVSYGAKWDAMAKENNAKFIGVECCHPGEDGEFDTLTVDSLVWLCAALCQKHGISAAAGVFRHYDRAGKLCPKYYVDHPDKWAELKMRICAAADGAAPSAWASGAWAWAARNGIADGTRPRDAATREEVVTLIWRAAGKPAAES